MIKLSAEVLEKFAEAAEEADYSAYIKPAVVAGIPALETANKYLINKINDAIPQDSSIGDIFYEFASKKLNEDRPGRFVSMVHSNPRSIGELVEKGALPKYAPFAQTYHAGASYSQMDSKAGRDYLNSIGQILYDNLKDTAAAGLPPWETAGFSADEIEAVKNSISAEDLVPWLKQKLNATNIAEIEAPRNNIYSIAHEFGHLDDLNRIDEIGAYLDKRLPGAHKVLARGLDAITAPVSSLLSEHTKWYPELEKSMAQTNPLARKLMRATLAGSVPGLATGLLGTSQTARDLVRKILPFQATDDAMSFVEEHPVVVAASGSIPQLLNEAYTSVPGYKYVKDFYSGLNKINADALTPDMLDALGPYAKRLGNLLPEKEALKFLGHNLLSNMSYLTVPLAMAGLAYLNAPKKKEESV